MTETMTPADELRAAAKKIRRLATRHGVPIGPWVLDAERAEVLASDDSIVFRAPSNRVSDYRTARHLMVWTPEVAHAVADMLDHAAKAADDGDPWAFLPEEMALRIARAINGEVAA